MTVAPVAILGGLTGLLAMLLYAKLTPQARVAELSEQVAEARLALNRFAGGGVRELFSMTRHAVVLSLRQMGLILGPTLLVSVLVLGVAGVAELVFHLSRIEFGPEAAPSWLCSGHAAFWIPLTVGAAGLKWALKIK